MSNISHHEVWGEGMFGDEQHWPLNVNVKGDPSLALRTKVLLEDY